MTNFLTLAQLTAAEKTVLLRADFNVPFKDGHITDTTRLTRVIPTIQSLLDKNCKIVIMSHLGRPKGEVKPEYSLAPVAKKLAELLEKEVSFCKSSIGEEAEEAITNLTVGEIVMLENLRFHKEEEANDPKFAQELAKLGDIFVNDAFSTAHRAHASTEGLSHYLPAYAGELMASEINALQAALETPDKPVAAIVGGAKISTKLELLNNLIEKVDFLILGGAMANTFLAALNLNVGASLVEKDMLETAQKIIENAKAKKCQIQLPTDVVVAKEFKEGTDHETVNVNQIADDDMVLDIGIHSVENILYTVQNCKTIVWNGPMGAFETAPFDRGTVELAKAVGVLTDNGLIKTVAGGGDTVAALAHADAIDQFTYVSTAGGAFLEWLEGKELPGIKALQAASKAA